MPSPRVTNAHAHDSGRPGGRPAGTLRIGRIAGSDILVSRSWFVVAALIAYVVAPQAERVAPGLGPWKYAAGLLFAIVLYGSVLLHEISHAVMARRYGFPVTSITLHFLGGMTAVEGEARRPREEFAIAVVGPITSLVVAGVGMGLVSLTEPGLLRLVLGGVAVSNLLIGLLNLVPGLPLDGGRVLKAAVWGATGNVHRGTMIAGWCGRALAVAALLWPFAIERVTGDPQSPLDYVMGAIIAVFLWVGATAAMASARLRRRLPELVGRTLARTAIAVPEATPVADAVQRAARAGVTSIVTTTTTGEPVGIVQTAAVAAIPDPRRPWVPVSAVAQHLETGQTLPASIQGEELVMAISRRPAPAYLLVEEDGGIAGVLVTEDVDTAFKESRH